MSEVISVVVPVYNVKAYLDECLTGIVNQSYTDIDIIVVDDGSTDGSEKMCDEWAGKDSRIKVIHQKNGGLSAARNTGIEASTGRYIFFVDSDDYVETDAVQTLYECAVRNRSDLTIGHGKWVSEDGTPIGHEEAETEEERVISKEEFWCEFCDNHDFVVAWSKLYKRELFDTVKFPVGKINEDFGIARHIIEQTETIACTNKTIYNYRVRQGSIVRSPFTEKNLYLIGERLNLLKYILGKDFSSQSKYYVCRRQFPDAMDGIGKGFKYLDTKDAGIKKILTDYYNEYKLIAKALLKGIDGSVTPDTFTKVSSVIYLLSRRGYFFLRSIKKKG